MRVRNSLAVVEPEATIKMKMRLDLGEMTHTELRWQLVVALLGALALFRVMATYSVFGQTMDEPFHLGCGMEWLQKGTYTLEPLHPPLARVAAALVPYLAGMRIGDSPTAYLEGNRVLYGRGPYLQRLAQARLGTLPFLLLAIGCVWWLGNELYGPAAGGAAALLFTLLPPVLAHGGLATTDMAVTATIALAVATLVRWLRRPSLGAAAGFGASAALAVLAKFSALIFLPACLLVILVAHALTQRAEPAAEVPRRSRRKELALCLFVAFITLWAGYRFSFHAPQGSTPPKSPGIARTLYVAATSVPVPAPEFLAGLHALWMTQEDGRRAYLLGEAYRGGKWMFFPVALGVKTPLGFLLLAAAGCWIAGTMAWRSRNAWMLAPAGCAALILLVSLPSRINIGLRHILPIYPFLALLAGLALADLVVAAQLERTRRRYAAAGVALLLALWCVVTSWRAHPDYLAYFNELAGAHPENILVDSDLDWGQDLLRLGPALRARNIHDVWIVYFGSARLNAAGLPPYRELRPGERVTGWVAASAWSLKMGDLSTPDCGGYCWLNEYPPTATVGKSILLIYVPPAVSH